MTQTVLEDRWLALKSVTREEGLVGLGSRTAAKARTRQATTNA
jgi:hypothetical protein